MSFLSWLQLTTAKTFKCEKYKSKYPSKSFYWLLYGQTMRCFEFSPAQSLDVGRVRDIEYGPEKSYSECVNILCRKFLFYKLFNDAKWEFHWNGLDIKHTHTHIQTLHECIQSFAFNICMIVSNREFNCFRKSSVYIHPFAWCHFLCRKNG